MTRDKSKDIVSDLADRTRIDWSASNSEQNKLIEQYKAIDKIAQVFNKLSFNDENNNSNSHESLLFQWGHLNVLEQIGEGSYGQVYRAYDSVLDRDVALKLLKQDKSSGIQSRAFMQEAKRLAKVRNRYVLAVHGANIFDSRVGMWSDLINGKNLSETNFTPYSYKELIHIIASIADALQAVHAAGLVHGDIKPSNVMQDLNGELILMDFGAGIESSEEPNTSGYVVATPLMMSPELFNDEAISSASDIYAFGVLLFKLAAGQYPIQAKNIADVQEAHEHENYLSLHTLRTDLPKSVRNIIHHLMHNDPDKRPSASEILVKINWIVDAPKRRKKQWLLTAIFSLMILAILISTVASFRVNQEKQKADAVNSFMLQMLNSTARLGKGRDVRVADILDYAATTVNTKFANQPYAKATIHNLLGNSYINLQLPENSLKQLNKSLDLKMQLYAPDDPEVLNTLYLIAFSYQKLGNSLESKKRYDGLIHLSQNNLKANAQIIQLAKIRLAQLLIEEGDLLVAEKQLIAIIQQISVENDINGDNGYLSLFILANIYRAQSKFKLAEEAARKSLAWLNEYSNNSQDNINAANELIASSLANQGRFKEAEALYRQVLIEAEKLYGTNNAGYLAILINFGGVLQLRNKAQESMQLLVQALEVSKIIQGQKSLATILIGINLANTKVSLGDMEGGEALIRDTLEDAMQELGKDHVETLKLEYNLAELLNNTERFKEAEILARRNNIKMLNKLGKTHLFTLLSSDNIAVSLSGQKQYKQAQTLYQQILTAIADTMGENNPYYLLVLSHHIETLQKSKQVKIAKKWLLKLIQLQTELLGEQHIDTINSKAKLSALNY